MKSEGLFRLGIVSLLLVLALDVIVAGALYHVFSPVNRALSMLAACFKLVYAGVFLVAMGHLFGVARLLDDTSPLSAHERGTQLLLGVNAFSDVWAVGLFLFGLHLLVIGYLAHRSGHVPRLLGFLLAVAGLGYGVDTVGAVLSRGPWTEISSFTFIGEFLLALWLVTRGRHISVDSDDFPVVAVERPAVPDGVAARAVR